MPQSNSASVEEFERTLAALERFASRCAKETHGGQLLTPYRLLELLDTESRAGEWLGGEEARVRLRAALREEICAMAIPALLDGGENALAVAATTATGDPSSLAALQAKFSALAASDYLKILREQTPPGYGFVSYPAYTLVEPQQLVRRFGPCLEQSFRLAYPVIYELTGLVAPGAQALPGWLAFVFAKPARMKEQVALVREKTREALVAMERLNGRLIGLGGWLASLTDGGAYLEDKTTAKVTTGHAYTIANILNTMLRAAEAVGLLLSDAVVAVVGAAGSVGSGVAQLSAQLPIRRLILFDERSLDGTLQKVRQVSSVPSVAGKMEEDLNKAHVVLVATTASKELFDRRWFRPGAIVIDDSQPKNVDRELLAERKDLLVLEGGVVSAATRGALAIRPAFGPALKNFHWSHVNLGMAGADEVPSCLAEVMIWSLLGETRERYSLGKASPELAGYLDARGREMGFGPGELQCFGDAVEPARVAAVRRVLREAETQAASPAGMRQERQGRY
jgi:predicted amino acid dehydrogenase